MSAKYCDSIADKTFSLLEITTIIPNYRKFSVNVYKVKRYDIVTTLVLDRLCQLWVSSHNKRLLH